ncbi:Calponin homology domain-containing proteinromo [Phytophthora infestans]|uniref:Calponin homology domain-containing proteinromo n=1 Tax=Phytophthora infestans TaxID=4787 RepID=A0A833WP51_PHYIN|nr:Calponin homology domain-containing proteinromo [Phytophthora infestans]
MAAAQRSWHRNYDCNRPATSFAIDDKVLLDTKNLDISHIGSAGKRKFASRFIGPYRIEAVTGPDRYRLVLPDGLRLFPEFRVSLLRRYYSDPNPSRRQRVPAVLVADGPTGHLVQAVTGHRKRKGIHQYKIKWIDSSLSPSWEPLSNLGQVKELIREYLDQLPTTRTTALLKKGL